MMSNEKYERMIDKLYDGTRNSKLTWENEQGPEVFCSIAQNAVWINKSSLKICDWFGDEIDRVEDEDLGPEYRAKLSDLHKLALRQARGVDEVLDNILDNLP